MTHAINKDEERRGNQKTKWQKEQKKGFALRSLLDTLR